MMRLTRKREIASSLFYEAANHMALLTASLLVMRLWDRRAGLNNIHTPQGGVRVKCLFQERSFIFYSCGKVSRLGSRLSCG